MATMRLRGRFGPSEIGTRKIEMESMSSTHCGRSIRFDEIVSYTRGIKFKRRAATIDKHIFKGRTIPRRDGNRLAVRESVHSFACAKFERSLTRRTNPYLIKITPFPRTTHPPSCRGTNANSPGSSTQRMNTMSSRNHTPLPSASNQRWAGGA